MATSRPTPLESALDRLSRVADPMADTLAAWCSIPSGSTDLPGLETMAAVLEADFGTLADETRRIPCPDRPDLAPVLTFTRRSNSGRSMLLVSHRDTVFGPGHPFRSARRSHDRLHGPGAIDAKGGLVVLRWALEAFDTLPCASDLGWQLWIPGDEELGSPGSSVLLSNAARGHEAALVFEPGQKGGALVGARKGSGIFHLRLTGRTAHAGRNPQDGRNAVHAAAELVIRFEALVRDVEGVTLNVGRFEGGGALNVVPDRAQLHLNVRSWDPATPEWFETLLAQTVAQVERTREVTVEVVGGFQRLPKPVDGRSRALYDGLVATGRNLGQELEIDSSGGVSDGNLLAARGLAVAEGLGPWGDGLHTDREFAFVSSLPQRARLTVAFLAALAEDRIPWPGGCGKGDLP